MIKEVRTYVVTGGLTPTLEDIQECVNKAKENDCIIELKWVHMYSGMYSRFIDSETDAEKMLIDDISKIVYGL